MASVLVTEDLRGPALEALTAEARVAVEPGLWREPPRLRARLPEFDALMVRNQTRVDAALIGAAPRLQVIGRCGVGLDNIDLDAASRAGVVVTFAPAASTNAVAELAIGLALALARGVPAADRHVRGGGWDRMRFAGVELEGKTLGVVGCGRIGLRTAAKARALGLRVVGHDPFVAPDALELRELGLALRPLGELLAEADVGSLHLPETPGTRGLFGAAEFAAMKRGALFVNTARGGLVDEAALAAALAGGQLGGAALDVRAEEPPAALGPLAGLDNVILTPHVGAFTREAQAAVMQAVCADVAAVLRGERARHAVHADRPRREAR
jgi:D-3-phosphoglycerate dehydrogenase